MFGNKFLMYHTTPIPKQLGCDLWVNIEYLKYMSIKLVNTTQGLVAVSISSKYFVNA